HKRFLARYGRRMAARDSLSGQLLKGVRGGGRIEKKGRRSRTGRDISDLDHPGYDIESDAEREIAAASLRRQQEEEVEDRRRQIWASISRKIIPKVVKLVQQHTSSRLLNCKRVAQVCQREARKASKSGKSLKDIQVKAKRANREV